MSEITLNLATLNEDQLAALSLVSPEAVAAERERRFRYPTIEEALGAFESTHLHLSAVLSGYKGTPAVKAVQETGIIKTGERMMATLRAEGIQWEKPTAIPLVTPVRRNMS